MYCENYDRKKPFRREGFMGETAPQNTIRRANLFVFSKPENQLYQEKEKRKNEKTYLQYHTIYTTIKIFPGDFLFFRVFQRIIYLFF